MNIQNGTAHEAIRQENLENPKLRAFLNEFALTGAHYLPCAGNMGDGLIALGTLQLFADLGLDIPVLTGLEPEHLDGIDSVIVGGGGGWVEGAWEHYAKLLEPFLQRGGRALVLPTTVSGFARFFERYGRQIVFFAREQHTSDFLADIEAMTGQVFSAHDLAFNVDLAKLDLPPAAPQHDTLKIFRTDAESSGRIISAGAPDLPSIWDGLQWDSIKSCLPPLQSVASIILQFKSIETDRLHMAVLAAMLGRRVVLRSNSYFKNEAIFAQSLVRFDQATLQVASEDGAAGLWQDNRSLQIKLDMHRAEIQQLRSRVLHYAAENDRLSAGPQDDPLLHAYLQSRGFRVWQHYLALYDRPTTGPMLRQGRRLVGAMLRFARRARA